MVGLRHLLAASLLQVAIVVAVHDHGSHNTMALDTGSTSNSSTPTLVDPDDPWLLPSYSGLEAHSGSMLAHVLFMIAAWFLLLPIGVMLSIARSRLAIPSQFLFLALNASGLFFGVFYNINTPDLYANNAHHKIGWVMTWVTTGQLATILLFAFSRRSKEEVTAASAERTAFLPMSIEAMAQYQRLDNPGGYKDIRWSDDSGQGTERASSSLLSHELSTSDAVQRQQAYVEPEADYDDQEKHQGLSQRRGMLWRSVVYKSMRRMSGVFSQRWLKVLEAVYDGIDRTILMLGFIALLTGCVTYAGIFRANNIFNGLAHFVKGGIFFWYGLLTLGRWMGCFADVGWAWNIKPGKSKAGAWRASMPTAEFMESFVIWLYGATNGFLEHMAAWGGAWTAQDLEHVSISIMFFGGGLCGMLIESRRVRSWLNTSISLLFEQNPLDPNEAASIQSPPRTYSFPMNPLPALIILLLGLMMSSHHQDSMVSTAVHKQWGTLLVGFALARAVTYTLFFISPPTSIFPSRPPSELVAAFCLISGGLIFMASTKDVIHVMEEHDLMPMFIFTVCMGFTAFLMAYEMVVLAVKGWATRREDLRRKRISSAMVYGA